jgi:hypothetical protein
LKKNQPPVDLVARKMKLKRLVVRGRTYGWRGVMACVNARPAQIRLKFENMVQHINHNGGWTIVGWFMMGSVVDAASNAADKIQNNEITIHISYLYPTEVDDVVGSEGFNAHLIV